VGRLYRAITVEVTVEVHVPRGNDGARSPTSEHPTTTILSPRVAIGVHLAGEA
jgi:hypothetical protein